MMTLIMSSAIFSCLLNLAFCEQAMGSSDDPSVYNFKQSLAEFEYGKRSQPTDVKDPNVSYLEKLPRFFQVKLQQITKARQLLFQPRKRVFKFKY